MSLRFRTFDPVAASDAEWEQYYAFITRRREEAGAPDPAPTLAHWRDWLRTEPDNGLRQVRVAEEGDRIVSVCDLVLLRGESVRLDATAGVLRDWRRQGIGSHWLSAARAWMRVAGAAVLLTKAKEEDGHEFLRHRGFTPMQVSGVSKLDLAAVDRARLGEWVAAIAGTVPGTALEVREAPHPDGFLAELAPLVTAIERLVPGAELLPVEGEKTPESLRRAVRRMVGEDGRHHAVVAREPDGTLSGMTDVGWRPDRPDRAHQMLTGVLPPFRGRGLGKALKARMLLHLLDVQPEVAHVTTSNATTNAPMLAINDRLGYRREEEVTIYRLLLENAPARGPSGR